jgi:hypothetical protein
MTILDRIVAYVKEHAEGVDDDELAWALELKRRQRVDSRCSWRQREGGIYAGKDGSNPVSVKVFINGRFRLKIQCLLCECLVDGYLPKRPICIR